MHELVIQAYHICVVYTTLLMFFLQKERFFGVFGVKMCLGKPAATMRQRLFESGRSAVISPIVAPSVPHRRSERFADARKMERSGTL